LSIAAPAAKLFNHCVSRPVHTDGGISSENAHSPTPRPRDRARLDSRRYHRRHGGTRPGPAGADQVSSLKAQATAIAQKLVEEQLQVGAYQQQYSVASARTAAEARSIAQIGQQIKGDEQQIAARTALVRTQAIRSYMDYGTGRRARTRRCSAATRRPPRQPASTPPSPSATSRPRSTNCDRPGARCRPNRRPCASRTNRTRWT